MLVEQLEKEHCHISGNCDWKFPSINMRCAFLVMETVLYFKQAPKGCAMVANALKNNK